MAPPPSAARQQDRARAACGWGCRAAGRLDCRSFSWPTARARIARRKGIRINQLRFLDSWSGKQEITGKIRGIGTISDIDGGLRDERGQHVGSPCVPFKNRNSATPPGSSSRKGTWRQAGPISSRAKSATHPQSDRRLVRVKFRMPTARLRRFRPLTGLGSNRGKLP
jgi:hypothetical protein